MKKIILYPKTKQKKQKKTNQLGIFIDYANLLSSLSKIEKNIDFKKLITYLEEKFDCKAEFKAIYYAYPKIGTRNESYNYKGIHNFMTFLNKELGFYLKKKPLKLIELRDKDDNLIIDENGKPKCIEKGNLDIELTMNVMQTWHNFDKIILFSGDSDFKCLLEFLIWKGKKVHVFSTTGNISSELKNHSSRYYDIAKLPQYLFRKTKKTSKK